MLREKPGEKVCDNLWAGVQPIDKSPDSMPQAGKFCIAWMAARSLDSCDHVARPRYRNRRIGGAVKSPDGQVFQHICFGWISCSGNGRCRRKIVGPALDGIPRPIATI